MSVLVGPDITVSVLLMRFANILIFLGITTALFLLLPRARRPALLGAWIITSVPLGLFLIASNNPSAWAIIGVGSAWIALLGYFETGGRRKYALGAVFAIAAIVAAGSRADAALYIVLSVVVVGILTFVKTRAYLLSWIVPFCISVISVLFFALSRQSAVVASGLGSSADGATGASVNVPNLLAKNLMNVPSLWAGVFGTWGLGWLDTVLPAVVPFGGIVAFIAVAFSGLANMTRRRLIALGLVALALWLIPTYVLVMGRNSVGENVQPRYLLPLIVVFGGLFLLTEGGMGRDLSRLQLSVVGTLLAVAEAVALYTNMRRYITGTDSHGWNLDVNIEWWWNPFVSPMFVWAVGSLAFAALLVVLVREMTRANAIR
jgi:Predicted membrane protein (DUF2142)